VDSLRRTAADESEYDKLTIAVTGRDKHAARRDFGTDREVLAEYGWRIRLKIKEPYLSRSNHSKVHSCCDDNASGPVIDPVCGMIASGPGLRTPHSALQETPPGSDLAIRAWCVG